MIYLDHVQETCEAAIAVLAEPQDTKQKTDSTELYFGRGKTAEEAIRNAEQMQNRKMFYSHNEILLLGPGAGRKVGAVIEEISSMKRIRPYLSVFLTAVTPEQLRKREKETGALIAETERMIRDPRQHKTQTIGDAVLRKSRYLPVLEFSSGKNHTGRITKIAVLLNKTIAGYLQDDRMQIFLMLHGKENELDIRTKAENHLTAFKTQNLHIGREFVRSKKEIRIRITGNLTEVAEDGKPLKSDQTRETQDNINRWIEKQAAELILTAEQKGADPFYLHGSQHEDRKNNASDPPNYECTIRVFSELRIK